MPGFIDLQVNGGNGILFNNDTSVRSIKAIAKAVTSGFAGVLGVHIEGRLAGSAIGMMDAVRINTLDVGIALDESLKMASRYPAEFMQLDQTLGFIKPGYRSDLVHFSDSFTVQNTWVGGERQTH